MEPDEYLRTLDRIYDLPKHLVGRSEVYVPSREERLERIEVTRGFLDHACPGWRDIKVVHIGGTSGKGSTAWMLAAMLSREHRTGLVTSPHLFDLRERIRVDLEPISRDALVGVFEGTIVPRARELVGDDPRFALRFPEVILSTAFAHFLEAGVEWAMVEVALGGRYDQTNAVEPVASVITNISLDHMHLLGATPEEIAWHKAGIAKRDVPLYTSEVKEGVLEVLREEAGRVGAPFHVVHPEEGGGDALRFRGREWHVGMRGPHQRTNAALALAVALDLAGLGEDGCADALATAQMPGRFDEVVPGVIADVAHNPAKTQALARTVGEALVDRRTVLVVGIVDVKDHGSVLGPLLPVADHIVFTRSRHRGADPTGLLHIWTGLGGDPERAEVVEGPKAALTRAQALAGEGGVVLVTGSSFVVDEVLNPDDWMREANAGYVSPGKSYELDRDGSSK
jgi:dihydrofolate synthase/folylpolyglutamate synthase